MNDMQVKCFLAAAKFENFTKAAENLYLSQPVLGRHISNLETELGFLLFVRERKSVKLTENGRIFEKFLLACERNYNIAMETIQTNLRSNNMNLIIGTAEGQLIGESYSPVFRYLVDHMSNLHVTVSYFLNNELLEALKKGTIDAAILNYDDIANLADIEYKKLRVVGTCLIIPITHPMAKKSDIKITDFKDERFILLGDSELATEMQKNTMQAIGTNRYIVAPDISTLIAWTEAGIGITTVPDNHKLCYSPNLVPLTFDEISLYHTEVLAWRRQNKNPGLPAFCNILEKTGYHMDND